MLKSTSVFSELHPEWVVKENEYDADFWTIVDFFLLHSLCDGQSWKGTTLQSYLWKPYPWVPASYLKDRILSAIWGKDERRLYMADNRSNYQNKIAEKSLDSDFYKNSYLQRAGYVIVCKGKNNDNEIMSLLYHIRNSFAHGRYGMTPLAAGDYMIFMEDGVSNGNQFEVTARIVLKKSSLLKIREIIMNGPDDNPDYMVEIQESIKRGHKTKKNIIADLQISENIWNNYSHKLSSNGTIVYNHNKKTWELN